MLANVGIWLLKVTMYLPLRWLMFLGSTIGGMAYRLARKRQHIVATNIYQCFPELDEPAKQQMVKNHFHSAGKAIFELGMAGLWSDKRLLSCGEVRGIEYLEEAFERSKGGIILVACHMMMIDLSIRLLKLNIDYPLYAFYKPTKNKHFDRFWRNKRLEVLADLIPHDNIRHLFRILKERKIVLFLPDQNNKKQMEFVPFFGIKAATTTSILRIVERTGAEIVPFFQHRKNDHSGYVCQLLPAIKDFPFSDDISSMQYIHALMEKHIRLYPDQYLWMHRRFKTRPEGEPPFYST